MNDQSGKFTAIREIWLLLDYLDRSPDNRLMSQFDDARASLASAPLAVAKPPCHNYRDFLSRLAVIETRAHKKESQETRAEGQSNGDPDLDDLSFLRWSRNFLATVAAPATLDSVRTTREFIQERARLALMPRWKALLRLSGPEKRDNPTGGRDSASSERVSIGAKWLARSARRLEFWLIITTIFTVSISAYAMVGKYISDQKTDALQKFQKAGDVLTEDIASTWQTQPGASIIQLVSAFNACSADIGKPPISTAGVEVEKAAAGAAGPIVDAATMKAAQKLIHDCEELRREKFHLMAEDIRLRSWESILLGGREWWTLRELIGSVAGPIVGWSNGMVRQVGAGFDEPFCNSLKSYYNANDCHEVVRGIVEGTGSTSSAILGCITLYFVPALYSLIGAGAATMRYLRHRVETSTLSITDRHRIAYNLILGCAFGAIIGLFARYLGNESNIGPAVVALLAGFNVPAVFSFLGELSNRVFGMTETAAVAK